MRLVAGPDDLRGSPISKVNRLIATRSLGVVTDGRLSESTARIG